MSITVILRGPLVTFYGIEKIEYSSSTTVTEIVEKIDNGKNIIYDKKLRKIRSGYIILVNGKDYRLLNRDEIVKDGDVIEIIPINHGG